MLQLPDFLVYLQQLLGEWFKTTMTKEVKSILSHSIRRIFRFLLNSFFCITVFLYVITISGQIYYVVSFSGIIGFVFPIILALDGKSGKLEIVSKYSIEPSFKTLRG